MLRIKWILMGMMSLTMMGCGASKAVTGASQAVVVSHEIAAGHKLMVMRPAAGAHMRFVSHKQHGFNGAPSIDDGSVAMCVAAAFTLDTMSMDVCGDHVVAGERIKGYDDVTATGHMLIINNKVEIRPNDLLERSIGEAVNGSGYLFQQCLIVENGRGVVDRIPKAIRDRRAHIIYRAACVMDDGSLAIVQGEEKMFCGEFIDALIAIGAQQALYLDMGTWAWGWVRETGQQAQELAERFYNTRYQSNWLIFSTQYKGGF